MVEREGLGQQKKERNPIEKFERASSQAEKRKLGRELVVYATKERFDALAIFETVNLSLNCLAFGNNDDKRIGKSILQQLDQALSSIPTIHKSFLPVGEDQKTSLTRLNKLFPLFEERLKTIPRKDIP